MTRNPRPRFAFHTLLALLACVGLAPVGAAAAPARAGSATRQVYRVDLTRDFGAPAAERADWTRLLADVNAFVAAQPDGNDARAVLASLRRAEALTTRLERHDKYLFLKANIDRSDRASAAADDDVAAQLDRVRAAVDAALLRLSQDQFEADVRGEPALAHYAFLRAESERRRTHVLPPAQQTILDSMASTPLSALADAYDETVANTPFARIETSSGSRDPRRDRTALLADPDPEVRRHATEALLAGFDARAPVYAALLTGIVRTRDTVARLRHFADAPEARYFDGFLTPAGVRATLASVARHGDVCKLYQRTRAAEIAAASGLSEAHSWDLSVPPAGVPAPRFSIDQARAISIAALEPLGSEYVAQFAALMDPAHGRADIGFGGANRGGRGFSIGSPGVTSALFVGDFEGYVSDASTLIHEGGHAVHRELMSEHGVSPFYGEGPHWMFEAFAILNGFLLRDHLYHTAAGAPMKAYYLNDLVEQLVFQIFTSAEETDLEQSIYEGVEAGRIRTAADLDRLTLSILGRYEIWPAHEPERAHLWMTKSLMYEDPLYLVNYLYAGLLATRLYAMALDDPAVFQRRYMALLSHGFDAGPSVLLRRFFGRDVSMRELADDDMKILARRIDELSAVSRDLDRGARAP